MIREVGAADTWPDDLVSLYREQYAAYARLAFLLVGSTVTAEEVVQEAFVAVRKRWEDVHSSRGGYVRQAVVNGARMRMRRTRVENRPLPDPAPPSAPAELVELRDALERLPIAQRTAIVLRFWADLPDDETAAILRCRVATVRSHISRGVATLRKELS